MVSHGVVMYRFVWRWVALLCLNTLCYIVSMRVTWCCTVLCCTVLRCIILYRAFVLRSIVLP